ncbi:hypothetical protein A3A71_03290 [Candidatus Berkelbacteria bacterium RIFCSPLOWO2_01_FULL_50_28]|uniref:Uncharacterized protein n=1 Tax=Candidatus Berkelbacteria bacterium RIFCSPLOWO2_01_FULL_50_28 TaxID=1797471 RepID=A0A1F5ECI1_9BACT|nr:MAG: hypothetical protein A2807_02855 [Candidatus Berkelbacteria bacterium RIFCSPHIGHO2_01_FULL_50_36]OGD65085.1 MAG: hypothetical protein A3A71_03290 [Candidatus Berkelbacteria bacterium RIFCSPLOWO2_01_FULL_50_28]
MRAEQPKSRWLLVVRSTFKSAKRSVAQVAFIIILIPLSQSLGCSSGHQKKALANRTYFLESALPNTPTANGKARYFLSTLEAKGLHRVDSKQKASTVVHFGYLGGVWLSPPDSPFIAEWKGLLGKTPQDTEEQCRSLASYLETSRTESATN